MVRCISSLPLAALAVLTAANLPAVTVTGPIASTTPLRDPAHGYPYNATPLDLTKQGYVEEEFFIEGAASAYNTPAGQPGSVKEGGHSYKTRIVVGGPKPAPKFHRALVF
jgi:hypothetical protein